MPSERAQLIGDTFHLHMLVFEQRENLSKQRGKPKTQPQTQTQPEDSNPGHIGTQPL